MFPLDYTFEQDGILYKHTVTDTPPCDSFYMHTHNLFELLYFISGDATYIIEDRKYKLRKGDLIFVRPTKYHFIQIDSSLRYERYDILFSPDTCNFSLPFLPSDTEVINLLSDPVADGIFKRMDYYAQHLGGKELAEVMKLLIRELFYCVSIDVKKTEGAEFSVVNPLLSKALGLINENLFSIRDMSEVAAALFVSESYLFRLFKSELKQSPKKYIVNKRLLAAQSMIVGGESPTSVYEKCGFGDYTAFFRAFRKEYGLSPREYVQSLNQ